MKRVSIERVNIRHRGTSSQTVHAAARGLNESLAAQLSSQNNVPAFEKSMHLNSVTPQTVRVPRGVEAHELRQLIARAIADALVANKNSGNR